jgi:methionyl-tRNA formyltransferase
VARAVFFGSSDSIFSNRHFGALMETGCTVTAVVDVPPGRRASTNASRQAGGSFMEIARERRIPAFEPASPNDPGFVREMDALHPDLFIAVGYMLILKQGVLAVPRVVAANFHASLLPAYRGKHPVFWALRNGEPWCGLSVHEMSAGLDTGDIIFQVRVPTRESDSVSSLYERIMTASVPLVSKLVEAVQGGVVPRSPQPSEGASYFGATRPADFHIAWSMEAARISRWVTATPGQCSADINGRTFFLLDAEATEGVNGSPAGTVLAFDQGCCRIAAADGAVQIRRLRTADGKGMDADKALSGGH